MTPRGYEDRMREYDRGACVGLGVTGGTDMIGPDDRLRSKRNRTVYVQR